MEAHMELIKVLKEDKIDAQRQRDDAQAEWRNAMERFNNIRATLEPEERDKQEMELKESKAHFLKCEDILDKVRDRLIKAMSVMNPPRVRFTHEESNTQHGEERRGRENGFTASIYKFIFTYTPSSGYP